MIGNFFTTSASDLSTLFDRFLDSTNSIISAFIRLQLETRRVACGDASRRPGEANVNSDTGKHQLQVNKLNR